MFPIPLPWGERKSEILIGGISAVFLTHLAGCKDFNERVALFINREWLRELRFFKYLGEDGFIEIPLRSGAALLYSSGPLTSKDFLKYKVTGTYLSKCPVVGGFYSTTELPWKSFLEEEDYPDWIPYTGTETSYAQIRYQTHVASMEDWN